MRTIRILLVFYLSLLLLSTYSQQHKTYKVGSTPVGFESEINEFIQSDAVTSPPSNSYLFVGSSTIRMWTNLQADFPTINILQRGFGGSTMNALNYYLKDIVLPYKPKAIIVYEGDNDISGGTSPSQFIQECDTFIQQVHRTLPYTAIYFISIKPSYARIKQIPLQNEANEMLKNLCLKRAGVNFIDIRPIMFTAQGELKAELFLADSLHLNARCYSSWAQFITPIITKPSNDQRPQLVQYLAKNKRSPENYILSKFNTHDIVFVGEYHRIKHDVDLIKNLIPLLYKNKIYDLGIEFGLYTNQHLIDSLVTAPEFNREMIDSIYFTYDPVWGYKEYIDLYQVTWQVNHKRKKGTPQFRIVNMCCKYNPCLEKPFGGLDYDIYMAEVIKKEFIAKGRKALIYTGCHHAFTKYHQPLMDFEKDTLYGLNTTRMGNLVYDSIRSRSFNIYLHAAWISDKGFDEDGVLPVNGAIDSVMASFQNKRMGFDVIGTPFGALTSTDSYYTFGHPNFTLDQFCDGYIYQVTFKDYQPITMEPNFYTYENLPALKKFLGCLHVDSKSIDSITIENANEQLLEDIRNHFKHLMK